jgi:hypothetical protein
MTAKYKLFLQLSIGEALDSLLMKQVMGFYLIAKTK